MHQGLGGATIPRDLHRGHNLHSVITCIVVITSIVVITAIVVITSIVVITFLSEDESSVRHQDLLCLCTCRHQCIKGWVVLQHLATSIVVVTFLNKDELNVRHPIAITFVHGCIIGFCQCPLQVAINMYMVSMVASVFMTASLVLERGKGFQEVRLYPAACIMLANFTVGCMLPLAGNLVLEKKARESFLREHSLWVTASGNVCPRGTR
jgi:hypothetical protein